MALQITITDSGRAEIINAANTGTAPVEITEVGLGTGNYVPDPTQTALQTETKRLTTIAGLSVAADTIHLTIKDESADVYDVSEFGLYTASGTLFAVYSDATNSFMQKAAGNTLLLSVDIVLGTLDATNITFGDTAFANPPASETVSGVLKLSDSSMALAGIDDLTAMTPLKVVQAIRQFADKSRKNLIINGSFDIWQRGTNFASTLGYTADRWTVTVSASNVSRVAPSVSIANSRGGFKYHLNFQTSTNGVLVQRIESPEKYAGKTVSVSFWAKSNAGSGNLNVHGKIFTTADGDGTVDNKTAALTAGWAHFETQVTLDSSHVTTWDNAAYVSIGFGGMTDFDITGVQVEVGNKATDFENRNLAEELMLCQRYFEETYNLDSNHPGDITTFGAILERAKTTSSINHRINGIFSVQKRAAPSIVSYSPLTGASGQICVDNTDYPTTAGANRSNWSVQTSAAVTAVSANSEVKVHITAESEL